MIASVRGTVGRVTLTSVVVEVGGVGIEVRCAPGTLAGLRVGESAVLSTSLVVREDSLTLFGFADDDERQVFEITQTASGVGPKLALAMLTVHRPDALRRAVASEDLPSLIAVPGIGRKGAQRIVLELKDRLGPAPGATDAMGERGGTEWREQVRAALVGLGWSAREAEGALDAVAPSAEGDEPPPDVAGVLRAALQTLSKA